MAAPRKRQFNIASPIATAPTAEPAPVTDVPTSRRQDAKTPGAAAGRAAYTWRRTPEESLTMDELTIRLKRELGRAKLDHAEILAALTGLAVDNSAVFGALAARLQRDV